MLYYKVISNHTTPAFNGRYTKDNIFSYKIDRHGRRVSCQYIADELITPAELKRLYGITADNISHFPFLQPVNVKKTEVHFSFGARFEDAHTTFYCEKDGTPLEEDKLTNYVLCEYSTTVLTLTKASTENLEKYTPAGCPFDNYSLLDFLTDEVKMYEYRLPRGRKYSIKKFFELVNSEKGNIYGSAVLACLVD